MREGDFVPGKAAIEAMRTSDLIFLLSGGLWLYTKPAESDIRWQYVAEAQCFIIAEIDRRIPIPEAL